MPETLQVLIQTFGVGGLFLWGNIVLAKKIEKLYEENKKQLLARVATLESRSDRCEADRDDLRRRLEQRENTARKTRIFPGLARHGRKWRYRVTRNGTMHEWTFPAELTEPEAVKLARQHLASLEGRA